MKTMKLRVVVRRKSGEEGVHEVAKQQQQRPLYPTTQQNQDDDRMSLTGTTGGGGSITENSLDESNSSLNITSLHSTSLHSTSLHSTSMHSSNTALSMNTNNNNTTTTRSGRQRRVISHSSFQELMNSSTNSNLKFKVKHRKATASSAENAIAEQTGSLSPKTPKSKNGKASKMSAAARSLLSIDTSNHPPSAQVEVKETVLTGRNPIRSKSFRSSSTKPKKEVSPTRTKESTAATTTTTTDSKRPNTKQSKYNRRVMTKSEDCPKTPTTSGVKEIRTVTAKDLRRAFEAMATQTSSGGGATTSCTTAAVKTPVHTPRRGVRRHISARHLTSAAPCPTSEDVMDAYAEIMGEFADTTNNEDGSDNDSYRATKRPSMSQQYGDDGRAKKRPSLSNKAMV